MTPARLIECLNALCWTTPVFAAEAKVSERAVRRWYAGNQPIPPPIADWLERLAKFHKENPPP